MSRGCEDRSNPLSRSENLNSRITIQEPSETRSRAAENGKALPGSSWAGPRIARACFSAKRLRTLEDNLYNANVPNGLA